MSGSFSVCSVCSVYAIHCKAVVALRYSIERLNLSVLRDCHKLHSLEYLSTNRGVCLVFIVADSSSVLQTTSSCLGSQLATSNACCLLINSLIKQTKSVTQDVIWLRRRLTQLIYSTPFNSSSVSTSPHSVRSQRRPLLLRSLELIQFMLPPLYRCTARLLNHITRQAWFMLNESFKIVTACFGCFWLFWLCFWFGILNSKVPECSVLALSQEPRFEFSRI